MVSSVLTAALIDELAVVMGALVGESGAARPVEASGAAAWVATSTVGGAYQGQIALGFSREDGAALATAVMGFEDTPEDAAVVDMIQEVASQAFSALGQRPEATGATLTPVTVVETEPTGTRTAFAITMGGAHTPTVFCWCAVEAAAQPAAPAAPARPAVAPAQPAAQPEATDPSAPKNLDVILDIELPLTVRFGVTEMTLEALTQIGPGSVIDLGRSPDDPVEVLVNGKLVARGEVVVVAGNYGVRIHEVVSAADRIRSMGD